MQATQAPAPPSTTCPSCGTPADQDQDFCLNCGRRLTPHYRRPPSWKLVATLTAAAVLAVGAGVGAAIGLSSGGHKKSPVQTTTTTTAAAAPPPAAAPTPTTPSTPTAPTTSTPAKPQTTPTLPGKPTTPAFPGAAVWPAGTTAYTVDLLETPSSKEANKQAKAAIKKGIPAGVIQSDGYQTLPPSLYVVFAGQYKTSAQAKAAADGYAKKGFGSAYGRLIQPKR